MGAGRIRWPAEWRLTWTGASPYRPEADTPAATLPILHDLQQKFGYIDDAAIPADRRRAQHLEGRNARRDQLLSRLPPLAGRRPRAEDLPSRNPVSRWDARISSRTLSSDTGSVVDEDNHSSLHVETVYCLGNCALSPAALLDGEPIGRLDRDRIDAIVAAAQGKPNERARLHSADSAALSVGADVVADAIARGAPPGPRHCARAHRIARPLLARAARRGRNPCGSRRLRADRGRDGATVRRGLPERRARTPKRWGAVEDIPYLAKQQRLIFARCGLTDPLSLDDYRRHGGLAGPRARAGAGSRRRRSRKFWPPACVGGAAPAFRPASNGARSLASRPIRNTSSATPTRATAARSPTVC